MPNGGRRNLLGQLCHRPDPADLHPGRTQSDLRANRGLVAPRRVDGRLLRAVPVNTWAPIWPRRCFSLPLSAMSGEERREPRSPRPARMATRLEQTKGWTPGRSSRRPPRGTSDSDAQARNTASSQSPRTARQSLGHSWPEYATRIRVRAFGPQPAAGEPHAEGFSPTGGFAEFVELPRFRGRYTAFALLRWLTCASTRLSIASDASSHTPSTSRVRLTISPALRMSTSRIAYS
jgi:hypothetical protein